MQTTMFSFSVLIQKATLNILTSCILFFSHASLPSCWHRQQSSRKTQLWRFKQFQISISPLLRSWCIYFPWIKKSITSWNDEGDEGPGRSQNVQDMRSSESYKISKVPLQIAIGSEQQLREKTLVRRAAWVLETKSHGFNCHESSTKLQWTFRWHNCLSVNHTYLPYRVLQVTLINLSDGSS